MVAEDDNMEKPRPYLEPGSGAETSPEGPHPPIESAIRPAPGEGGSEKKNEEVEDYAAVAVSSDEDADEPPKAGLTAWLQVLGCYFLFFNSWCVLPSPHTQPGLRAAKRPFRALSRPSRTASLSNLDNDNRQADAGP